MPPELNIFFISMLPIIELRGAIPVGLFVYNLDPPTVFFWSVLGNIIPPVFIFLFLIKFINWVSRKNFYLGKLIRIYFNYLRRTKEKRIIQWGKYLALVSFVAIPLPVTGAWTGSFCAFLFGIRPRIAYPLIIVGVVIAGLIVTLSLTGLDYLVRI